MGNASRFKCDPCDTHTKYTVILSVIIHIQNIKTTMPTVSPHHIETLRVIAWEITENSIDVSWFVKATFSDLQPEVFRLYEASIFLRDRSQERLSETLSCNWETDCREQNIPIQTALPGFYKKTWKNGEVGSKLGPTKNLPSNSLWTLSSPDAISTN